LFRRLVEACTSARLEPAIIRGRETSHSKEAIDAKPQSV
jgi:hypothetical protein